MEDYSPVMITRLLLPLGAIRLLEDTGAGSFLGGLSGKIRVPKPLDGALLSVLTLALTLTLELAVALAAVLVLVLVLVAGVLTAMRLLPLLLPLPLPTPTLVLPDVMLLSSTSLSMSSIGWLDSNKTPSLTASFCNMYSAERTAALAMGIEYPCKSITMGLGVRDSLVSNSCKRR